MLKFALLSCALAATTVAASASTLYTATLNGASQVPPNSSPATGTADYTLTGNDLSVSLVFAGLTSPASEGHIHCCAPAGSNAGVAVPFTGFPSADSGSYSNTFDLSLSSVYDSAFLASYGSAAAAEAALISGLDNGLAYTNIHDATYPDGEIRGQIESASAVPEPGTFALLGTGFVGLVGTLRKRLARAA